MRGVASDLSKMELPDTNDLWAALRDDISPSQPGRRPFFAMNLFAIDAFRVALDEVLENDPLDLGWDEVVADYRRFQWLRTCISEACHMDDMTQINVMLERKKARGYPKKFAKELAGTRKAIYTYRVHAHANARRVSHEAVLYKIEKFEPLGIWARPPIPVKNGANDT